MTYQQSHISWSCCQQSKVCIESNIANGSQEATKRGKVVPLDRSKVKNYLNRGFPHSV
jgi:hypothetical protein